MAAAQYPALSKVPGPRTILLCLFYAKTRSGVYTINRERVAVSFYVSFYRRPYLFYQTGATGRGRRREPSPANTHRCARMHGTGLGCAGRALPRLGGL